MTPTPPSGSNPLIYRIADALGVFHLVAPVDHTHAQSEVAGLESALSTISTTLAAKANAAAVETALAGKAPLQHSHDSISSDENNSVSVSDGSVIIELNDGETGGELEIPVEKLGNLQRAINNPDSTPTANSDNLVTSGGVKAALDGKANASHGHESITGTNAEVACGQGEVNLEAQDEINMSFGDSNKATLTPQNIANLVRALANPDSTPTANSDNLVTSGGVKAAIDALLTNRIPIHQVAAILPKTTGHESEYELQNWLGDGKMALVLQTARPVEVNIEATGVDDAPDGTWSGSTDISFDLGQGIRTVKNIYDLMYAQLQNDYPGERIGTIENWKIRVFAKDTVEKDTACLINFYNPTSAE